MITDNEKAKLRFELANTNVQSIGRAQGIYVTLLLTYICVAWGVAFVDGNSVSFHIGPFELKSDGVLGITPFVLLFLTLVYIGSVTAAAPALAHLRDTETELFGSHDHSVSEFDTHKNLLDYLAVLQLNPRAKTRVPTDDDEPKSMVRRLPHLILPVLFVGSAFTSGWAVVHMPSSYCAVFIFGGCCFVLQVAFSFRPLWRGVARFLGAERTSDVFN
ncbi:MAG: hypothetical protein GZ088_07880 [Acidipila sp.]|nr:hypothetical protein [Acidipila sp.]